MVQRTTIYVSLFLYVSLTLSMYLSLSFLSLSLFLFLLFFLKCSLFVIFFPTYSVCLCLFLNAKRKGALGKFPQVLFSNVLIYCSIEREIMLSHPDFFLACADILLLFPFYSFFVCISSSFSFVLCFSAFLYI